MRKGVSSLLIAALLLFLWAAITLAQTPEKVREFVYGVNVFNGKAYHGTYYPLSEDTLYMLADVTNIISPRYTLVYFWPVTNEFKADWDGLSEVVDGTLEIVQRGQVVRTFSQTQYIIQYPHGFDSSEVYVYTGEETESQYQEFDRQRRAYRDGVAAYYEASRQYRDQLYKDVTEGTVEEEPPPPPPEPTPFLFYSTGIHDGFAVELAAGRYTIRLRDEAGKITPGSEKKLIVFSAQRNGVGYTVVPQDKWTIPEQSDAPDQVLYARSGVVIYLQPFSEEEYNELYFSRLEAPQNRSGSVDRRMWIHFWPQDAAYLEVVNGDRVVERVEKESYLVKQLGGTALGYEVVKQQQAEDERSKTRTPDIEGYEVRAEPDQSSLSVRLMDSDGQVIAGSQREIRVVNPRFSSILFLLPALPLVIGGGVIIWRKRRFARLPK